MKRDLTYKIEKSVTDMRKLFILFSFCLLFPLGIFAGSPIVPEEFSQISTLRYAADFLNKYADYVRGQKTEAISDLIRRTKEDGLRYIKGNDTALAAITPDLDFNIGFDNGFYNASWSNGNKTVVEVKFPANIYMLSFSDKKDMEKKMAQRLAALPDKVEMPEVPTVNKEKLRPVSYSDLYVLDRGFFYTPTLENLTVYRQSNPMTGECELMIEDHGLNMLESIQNMMLTGYSQHPVDMNVELTEYGYKSSSHKKPLSAIFDMLQEEGSVPYWGWKPAGSGDDLKGLYVWKNEEGGYVHVLSVKVPQDILTKGGDIKARLSCYVRLDNLKSLFEEYK